jgi:hypothetical protein
MVVWEIRIAILGLDWMILLYNEGVGGLGRKRRRELMIYIMNVLKWWSLHVMWNRMYHRNGS